MVKDYLGEENQRNKRHADLFQKLLQLAFGANVDVLVGHHLTFEVHGDISTENEVPAADTLLFDHDIMGKVFGSDAVPLMQRLAATRCEQREEIVRAELALRY